MMVYGAYKSKGGEFRGRVGVNGGNVGHRGKNGEHKGQRRGNKDVYKVECEYVNQVELSGHTLKEKGSD